MKGRINVKKLVVLILAVFVLLSSVSCGQSGSSGSVPGQAPSAADPQAMAEEEFNSAVQYLSDMQSSLQERIPEAESLLESVTREDVADSETVEALESFLDKAKAIQEIVVPSMESDIEKIQEQAQNLQAQANDADILYNELCTAISQVESSQQSLKEQKLRDSVTAKKAYTGKATTFNGYEAEYTVSVTGWIKASNADALQLAWEGVAKEGDAMPSLSSFHEYTNDGFSEANAAVAFGTVSFRNITQGFDITEENPISFDVFMQPSEGFRYSIYTPKMYINYSTNGKFSFTVSPLMKSNNWGPVVFMLVCPNVITPNDPDGAVLDNFELIISGTGINITPSW